MRQLSGRTSGFRSLTLGRTRSSRQTPSGPLNCRISAQIMKNNYIVKISDSQDLIFPEDCVVCGCPHNGQLGNIEMHPSASGYFSSFIWIFSLLDKISSRKSLLSIAGHQSCLRSVRRSYWFRTLLFLLIITPIYIIGREQGVNRLYMLFICILLALPFVLWEYSRPLPIEYDYEKGKYVFTFTNRSYAERFASLNNTKMELR